MRRLRRGYERYKSGFLGLFYGLTAFSALSVAFWQHQASAIMKTTTNGLIEGAISSHIGSAALALGWLGFSLTLICIVLRALQNRSFIEVDDDRGSVASDPAITEDPRDDEDFTQAQRGEAQGRSQQAHSYAPPPMARAAMDFMSGNQWVREKAPAPDRRRQTTAWVRSRRLPPQGFVEGEVTDESSESSGAIID